MVVMVPVITTGEAVEDAGELLPRVRTVPVMEMLEVGVAVGVFEMLLESVVGSADELKLLMYPQCFQQRQLMARLSKLMTGSDRFM